MSDLAIRTVSAPSEHELMVFQTMAKQAVDSKMYRGIGDQSGVLMIMLSARELGIPPCQALNGGLNVIQGKVEISARMMNALIRRAKHSVSVVESTDQICTLKGTRCDNGDTATVSFTIEEAQRAGLVKQGGGWTKWPKDMCFARAMSRLARQLFSDVVGMAYVEGEIVAAETAPIAEPVQTIEIEPMDQKNAYLGNFALDDHGLAMQYLKTVQAHFQCSDQEAYKLLLADPEKLQTKFESWKKRCKAA